MKNNLIDDATLQFPEYPLSGRMSQQRALLLDSHIADQREYLPWSIADGFVTVCGWEPNAKLDPTWPQPTTCNAVLLSPLAAGNRAGALKQTVNCPANATRLLMSVYARAGILDPASKSCSQATLQVLIDNQPLHDVPCTATWQRTLILVPKISGKTTIEIGYRDVPVSGATIDCAAAIADMRLTVYPVPSDYAVTGPDQAHAGATFGVAIDISGRDDDGTLVPASEDSVTATLLFGKTSAGPFQEDSAKVYFMLRGQRVSSISTMTTDAHGRLSFYAAGDPSAIYVDSTAKGGYIKLHLQPKDAPRPYETVPYYVQPR